MKVLYFIDQSMNKISSIHYKIQAQVAAWTDMGLNVEVFSLVDTTLFPTIPGQDVRGSAISLQSLENFASIHKRIFGLQSIFRRLDYNLIYTRWKIYRPFLISALMTNGRPFILEINSNDKTELRLESLSKHAYNILTRRYLIKNAAGLVCVTNELAKLYSSMNPSYVVIGNGVDVSAFPFVRKTGNKSPKIVFISTPHQKWHGFDKVLLLANMLKSCSFHIIGMPGQNTDNLTYYGYLGIQEANDIIKNSDFGICSLSLYTKKMREACPLKSRQYLAMGLPIIYAYVDPDLIDNLEFALKIPNSEENVISNLGLIRQFILTKFGNEQIRQSARDYAETFLDIKKKEQKRIDFMKRFVLEGGR